MPPPTLPTDIIQQIFSHLPLKQIYTLRRMSRDWLALFDHVLFTHLYIHDSRIIVRVGSRVDPSFSLFLACTSYDPTTKIFTFTTPADEKAMIVCKRRELRQIKFLLSQWPGVNNNNPSTSSGSNLPTGLNGPLNPDSDLAHALSRYAKVKFHVDFIEAVQKEYSIPFSTLDSVLSSKDNEVNEYVGDTDIIAKTIIKSLPPSEHNEDSIGFGVEFIKIRSSWLFGGASNSSKIPHFQILESRYSLLDELVDIKYSRHSPKVLSWILTSYTSQDIKTSELISHLTETKGDFDTRAQLEMELEKLGIEKRNIWKHSFVRRFLAAPEDQGISFDEVLKKVKLASQESGKADMVEGSSKGDGSKRFRSYGLF